MKKIYTTPRVHSGHIATKPRHSSLPLLIFCSFANHYRHHLQLYHLDIASDSAHFRVVYGVVNADEEHSSPGGFPRAHTDGRPDRSGGDKMGTCLNRKCHLRSYVMSGAVNKDERRTNGKKLLLYNDRQSNGIVRVVPDIDKSNVFLFLLYIR